MFENIPIIGIVGGVGSGKSFVAKLFGELGCLVISSDEQVTQAYTLPEVRRQVAAIWGDDLFDADGVLNRKRLAAKVFTSPEDRRRLEALIHPVVARLRDDVMRSAAASTVRPVAFVWDTPLLFEAGLADRCDAVVFVDASEAVRQHRVQQTRGWEPGELARRENSQTPLDKKRARSHYVITNEAEEAGSLTAPDGHATEPNPTDHAVGLRRQVRSVLNQILARG